MMDREQRSRRIDEPEPCWVRMKLVRGGPWCGARIFTRLGMLAAEIDGKPADPHQVWHAGEFISEEQYALLIEDERRPNPWHPVNMSDAGLAERVREQEENDWWMTRPIA